MSVPRMRPTWWLACDYYGWTEDAEPGETTEDIVSNVGIKDGWSVESLKDYLPSSKVKAGAIDWDTRTA